MRSSRPQSWEVHAAERMVHIENEVIRIRHEMSDYKKQLSKLNELEEIKEMIRVMSSNQEANRRSTHGPPPPNPDKAKGVLGGPPNADPTPLHLQAGPSRPPPTWNNGSNGGHNGYHGGYNGNNGGPNGHQGGHNSYTGGQQSSSPELEIRQPCGPQASQYGARLGETQWENVNQGRRWGDRVEREPPMWEPYRERQGVHTNQVRIPQVRIDFPRFNGKDPLDWIFQVEEYFTCQFVQVEEWLQTSVLHFDGEARRWYRWLKHNEPVTDWEDFKDALLLRFGESAYVDYDIELHNLKQTSIVQEYQAHFESLASMVEWTPKSLIAATHKCKHIRVYTVLERETDDEEDDQPPKIEEVYESETKEEPQKEGEAPPEGECRMMADPEQPEAIKILGRIGDRQVLVLLDSGATYEAESSHRGRGKAALHSVQTRQGQDDPSRGQEGGVGGVEQQGQIEVEFTNKLGVEVEGGARGSATTLSETLEDQRGGSSQVQVKSSLGSHCRFTKLLKTSGLSSLRALISSSHRIHSSKDRWLVSLFLLRREEDSMFHDFPHLQTGDQGAAITPSQVKARGHIVHGKTPPPLGN
ncbi:hypothetical protein EJ110_NYTH13378 [Nymphaea thermarum]|nr:hypothetical protein EJ110_NYTH13378 [Nymphaea thermarum]